MLDTMEMNFNCSKNLVYDLLINPTEIHKLIHKGMKLKKEDENVYSVVFYKVPWRIEVYPKEDSLIEYTVEADKSKKGFINSIAKKGLKEICIFIEL